MLKSSIKKIKYFSNIFFENYAGLDEAAELELHNLALNSCLRFQEVIPEKYKDYRLENIILAKACSYHTNIDKSLRQYFYINNAIKRILISKSVSRLFASIIVDTKDKGLHQSMKDKQYEEFTIEAPSMTEPNDSVTDILLFSSQLSHVKILDSYLDKSKITNYQLLLPKRLQSMLSRMNFQDSRIIYFEDFIEEKDKSDLTFYQEEFQQIFKEKEKNIVSIFNLLGKDFFISQKPGIENIFKFLIPQSLLYAKTFKKILKIKKPTKILGVRPRRIYDRAMFQVSKSLDIKTYLIFHSTIGASHRELWTSGIYNDIDHIFGWGKKHNELIKSDKLSKQVYFEEIGSPMFNMPPKNKDFVHKAPKVIYASTRNDKSIVFALTKAKKLINEISITLKVHPGEPTPDYINDDFFTIESGDFPIEDILENYDIFITSYSGSHIAAMCLGLPVLFAPFYFQFPQDLQSLYGINKETLPCAYAKNEKELLKILNKVINDEKYRNCLISDQTNYLTELLANHKSEKSVQLIDKRLLS